jgi:hypothetical protein
MVGTSSLPMRTRLSFGSGDTDCSLSTIIPLGVLTITATARNNRGVTYQQSYYQMDVRLAQSIQRTDFGTFLVKPQFVYCYWEPFSIEIKIQGVVDVVLSGGELCFVKQRSVVTIPMDVFKKLVFERAIAKRAFRYALVLASDQESRRRALTELMKTMKSKEASDLLMSLKWDLRILLSVEDVDSAIVLFYLRAILDTLSDGDVCRRSAICHWVLRLHSMQLPKYGKQFLEFLEGAGKFCDQATVYRQLRSVGFTDGILRFATVQKDWNMLIQQFVELGALESIYDYLEQIKSHNQFVQIVTKLLAGPIRERTKDYIIGCRRPLDKLIPVLVRVPECVASMVSDSALIKESPTVRGLYISALAMRQDDDRLVAHFLSGAASPFRLLQCCRSSGCAKAGAQVYIDQKHPERAVQFASQSLPQASIHDLLDAIPSPELRKRGFVKLLEVSAQQDRKATLAFLMKSDLFDFGELVAFMDDEYYVAAMEDRFTDFVQGLEHKKNMVTYRQAFGRFRNVDFILGLDACCHVCAKRLIGTVFIKFGCGHMVHRNCVEEVIAATGVLHGVFKPAVTDSCPIC